MRVPSSQSSVSNRPVDSSGHAFGTRTIIDAGEHLPVKRDVLGLAPVIEFLAHPLADLLADLAGVDRGIESPPDGKEPLQLLQVGFDRRLHVRILQFAGKRRALERARTMDLAERSGRGRMMLEALRTCLCQSGPSSALMRRLTKAQPIGGASLCSFCSSVRIFGRQQVGNGRHQLGDLHQRTFKIAESRGERGGFAGAIGRAAEQAPAAIARRDAADIGADTGISRGAGGEAVFFAVGHQSINAVTVQTTLWERR